MSQPKLSPDEKITAIALEQPDPFSRPGQTAKIPGNQSRKPQRDFSPLDEPVAEVAQKKEEPVEEKKETKKRGPKTKKLETIPEPTAIVEEIIVASRSVDGLPSYRAEFSGRDVFVGFPCYKTTNPVTAFAMIALALDFGRDKIRYDMSIGDAMVYHSRNRIAEKFLQTDAKYLFMMDDDIIPCIGRPAWMKANVASARSLTDLPLQRHILHRLINSGKTLVGGAYFGRQEGAKLMCSDQSLVKNARQYDDFIVPVDWIATGCLLVHRQVFLDIKEKFPELAPTSAQLAADPTAPFDFFLPMKGGVGEDVAFCHRAKQIGHQPHIDLGTPVFHVGYKTY